MHIIGDGRCLVSNKYIDNIIGLEILLDSQDHLQNRFKQVTSLELLLRTETVVATSAVVLFIILSEIVEQQLAATNR